MKICSPGVIRESIAIFARRSISLSLLGSNPNNAEDEGCNLLTASREIPSPTLNFDEAETYLNDNVLDKPQEFYTIEKIRTRSHWNISNITAKHPVLLQLCNYEDLNKAIIKAGGDPKASEVQVNSISELP